MWCSITRLNYISILLYFISNNIHSIFAVLNLHFFFAYFNSIWKKGNLDNLRSRNEHHFAYVHSACVELIGIQITIRQFFLYKKNIRMYPWVCAIGSQRKTFFFFHKRIVLSQNYGNFATVSTRNFNRQYLFSNYC